MSNSTPCPWTSQMINPWLEDKVNFEGASIRYFHCFPTHWHLWFTVCMGFFANMSKTMLFINKYCVLFFFFFLIILHQTYTTWGPLWELAWGLRGRNTKHKAEQESSEQGGLKQQWCKTERGKGHQRLKKRRWLCCLNHLSLEQRQIGLCPPCTPTSLLSLQGGSQHLPSIKVEKLTSLQEFNEEGSALFYTQFVTKHFLACSDFLSFSPLYSMSLFLLHTLEEWNGLKPVLPQC